MQGPTQRTRLIRPTPRTARARRPPAGPSRRLARWRRLRVAHPPAPPLAPVPLALFSAWLYSEPGAPNPQDSPAHRQKKVPRPGRPHRRPIRICHPEGLARARAPPNIVPPKQRAPGQK
eukprot:scaffold6813_cov123-Isochrysis_galbana.AAC.15